MLVNKWKEGTAKYPYISEQFRSMRQVLDYYKMILLTNDYLGYGDPAYKKRFHNKSL